MAVDGSEGPGPVVFHFAVLVYREQVSPERFLWFARSVTTSDLAFGSADDEAIEKLKEVFEVSILTAQEKGMSLHDWLAVQRPDEPKWFDEWLGLWDPPAGRVETTRPKRIEGCEIEAKIAWKDAA